MAPGKSIQSDEDLLAYIRKTAVTVYHPVGTCKMGVDDMSVVSPDNLKVKGMSNLRVIDASIMPSISKWKYFCPNNDDCRNGRNNDIRIRNKYDYKTCKKKKN